MLESDIQLPAIDLESATKLASEYLESKAVDISNKHLLDARWGQKINDSQWRWSLVWYTPDQFALKMIKPGMRGGGMLVVEVFDNGEVSHAITR